MTEIGHNVSLSERARRIRRNALRMGEVQGQGYIAQALGVADVLAVSYFHAANNISSPLEQRRGSCGHSSEWRCFSCSPSASFPV